MASMAIQILHYYATNIILSRFVIYLLYFLYDCICNNNRLIYSSERIRHELILSGREPSIEFAKKT
jgi:hypothetical protein